MKRSYLIHNRNRGSWCANTTSGSSDACPDFVPPQAKGYKERQMSAYVELQTAEFAAEKDGYTATKHQREVGTGYFDQVTQVIAAANSSITALKGSTEEEQFEH